MSAADECAIDDRGSNQTAIEASNHRTAKYHIRVCKSLELGSKSCVTFEQNRGLEMDAGRGTLKAGRTREEMVKSRFP